MERNTGTINEIRAWIRQPDVSEEAVRKLLEDSRAGVRKLAQAWLRARERERKERERLDLMWKHEREWRAKGCVRIAGVDEAGRGPLAGPVVAAAVILPEDFDPEGLNDSKQLSPAERAELRERIEREALAVGVGMVDAQTIDRVNILQATYMAMRMALSGLDPAPDAVLADAVTIPDIPFPQQGIIKGDALSHSIAAASVVAKTVRDEWMDHAARQYPEYGFDRHKGYGTPDHLEALKRYGITPIHRRSFAPVRELESVQLSLPIVEGGDRE
ncbi:ribonuclease HII [Staphylospora marina]|uniref:ribonuclease HII n=1 Tax=Staphylospora marina TaxID=2490858 RepID=UPI002406FB91|nr:ribonuclease HII [Staphylospora marina]